jgi:DNA topoisomerase-1
MQEYTLIITEKPSAARQIAEGLDSNGKPEEITENNVSYFVANRDKPFVVAPALGHLYTVVGEHKERKKYPVFDFKWAPRYVTEKAAWRTKACIQVFAKLAAGADDFIDACDYDIEGALIGFTILKYACEGKENVAKRMKYSTLTRAELEKSYNERMPHLDFGLVEAGRTRHEVDWLYGINLSRALTQAANRFSQRYDTVSTGRVQGPTLDFIVEREKSIQSFVPTPYWSILAEADIQGAKCAVEYEKKKILKQAEADDVVESCRGQKGRIERIERETMRNPPPIPFDLGALQSEAYRLFRYSPHKTAAVAERLYLEALISYPRTSSQKLPATIGYKNILKGLNREPLYRKSATELLEKSALRPREGLKDDPAHPAVYPTGNIPSGALDEPERRIWDLVVKRFLAVFGDSALKKTVKASINVNGYIFYLYGAETLNEGWMRFYKPFVRSEEKGLPPIKEGETVRLSKVKREDKFTQPPPRYNPSSLLQKMETEGIGTKATRAEIIDTLHKRKYTCGENEITPTELGCSVIQVLEKHASSIISVELTRNLEQKMDAIMNNSQERGNVILEAIDNLKPVLTELERQEETFGKVLAQSIQKARLEELIVGECPSCHNGKLIILYSRKTRKRFVGCTNYQNSGCRTFSLPQQGLVKPTGRFCKSCGWPAIVIYFRGRHPWNLCFNPDCPRKERKIALTRGIRRIS